MFNIQFVPECFAETELARILVQENDYLNHAGGIGDVSRVLLRKDLPEFLNIGFIDDDKARGPKYFDEFELVDSGLNVSLKKHPEFRDYLIIVSPAIEGFLLEQLNELDRRPSHYLLSDNFKEFRKALKSSSISLNEDYKRMLIDILAANTSGFAFIRNKVEELRNLEENNSNE